MAKIVLDNIVNEPFFGFDKKALQFLKALKVSKNNNKDWFDKNRDTYENFIKAPMKDLIDVLAVEIKKIDPNIVVNYKSIFRINRDIRFSKNKTPYKTHYSAAFAFGKVKSSEIPQFYFHFSPDEYVFAAGQYSMDTVMLKKIRAYIFNNFSEYKKITGNKTFTKTFGEVKGETLTNLPKEFDKEIINSIDKKDKLLENILKMKQFYVFSNDNPDVILDEKIVDKIINDIKITYDFTKFLHKATI
ncbi:MAG TPA: DUF2461 domain-containing protein [Ignavibacteria bacterium]|nr:DUF2461 domain-containing protein [Ignavibacteria bacterium]